MGIVADSSVEVVPAATLRDSYETRRRRGRDLRRNVPRSAHAAWSPPPDRPDPVDILLAQGESLIPELLAVRYARMVASPFTFFRGTAGLMAMDLAKTPVTGVMVQAAGDAHMSNFCVFATPERNVAFDVNDFDETLPGPWEWDLKRLCASIQVVALQQGFAPSDGRSIVTTAAREYRERIGVCAKMRALDLWYDRINVEDVIDHFPAS